MRQELHFLRALAFVGLLVAALYGLATAGPAQETAGRRETILILADAPQIALVERSDAACIPRERCCKVCTKGKACGNTCISASYTCHKGRGCACNASEICR